MRPMTTRRRDTASFKRINLDEVEPSEATELLLWQSNYQGKPPATIRPILEAVKSANWDAIATTGHRGVSGKYLRSVMLMRCQKADSNHEVWWGAQAIAHRLGEYMDCGRKDKPLDRHQVARADKILRDHGWLIDVGAVGRARKYRLAIGNTEQTRANQSTPTHH